MVKGQNIAELNGYDRSFDKTNHVPKRSGWRSLARLCVFGCLAVVLGFVWFLHDVGSYPRALENNVKSDGIVVLTGGYARLEPAVELLRQKHAERLLVSGVNRNNSDGSLKSALNIGDALYECCVDLDQDALDTVGNATGTAHWAASKNYNSLIIVTNDYHMPRSMLEMKQVLPRAELIPFAVRNVPASDESLSRKFDRYRVLIGEFGKFVAARLRGWVGSGRSNSSVVSAGLSAGW